MTAKRKMELAHSKTISYLKIDLDVKPPKTWLNEWIKTRKLILKHYNYNIIKVVKHETEHGWHIWFHIEGKIPFNEIIKLQFILGDDHQRVYFNIQRKGFKKFRELFNILFSKKIKGEDLDED